MQEVNELTHDDFATSIPYDMILSEQNQFQREILLGEVAKRAADVGIKNFKTLYKTYIKSLEESPRYANVTRFPDQPIELETAEYIADEWGISQINSFTGLNEEVISHPIMPVERLVNIDTGEEKLKLAFCRGDKRWRTVIVDRSTAFSAQKISCLSNLGMNITTENAKKVVTFLSTVESINYNTIQERKCVSRLGYIRDEGFSPYVDGLQFDGDANYRTIFEAISQKGKFEEWREIADEIRQGCVAARIVLAASFASAIIDPVGALPFFVHLWGGESGTGKTVALMLAASVWGNPEMGRYIQTFNSTVVGREKFAAFLNHLPMIIDELQLSRGREQFNIYALAEGVGRTRGNKTGGIDMTPTWKNCILTSGESPITSLSDGAGAINRVIEIECTANSKIISDGHKVSNALKRSYGHAGRLFVEQLYDSDDTIKRACEAYSGYFKALSAKDTTEKQAMAASIILTADELATEWIFKDGKSLTTDDISEFLASKSAASVGKRGYEYMCDWVAQNSPKFRPDVERGDVFGLIEGDYAYIIRSIFNKAASDAGFSPQALLSWLRSENLIQTRGKHLTVGKRVNGVNTECVCMMISGDLENVEDDIPF